MYEVLASNAQAQLMPITSAFCPSIGMTRIILSSLGLRVSLTFYFISALHPILFFVLTSFPSSLSLLCFFFSNHDAFLAAIVFCCILESSHSVHHPTDIVALPSLLRFSRRENSSFASVIARLPAIKPRRVFVVWYYHNPLHCFPTVPRCHITAAKIIG